MNYLIFKQEHHDKIEALIAGGDTYNLAANRVQMLDNNVFINNSYFNMNPSYSNYDERLHRLGVLQTVISYTAIFLYAIENGFLIYDSAHSYCKRRLLQTFFDVDIKRYQEQFSEIFPNTRDWDIFKLDVQHLYEALKTGQYLDRFEDTYREDMEAEFMRMDDYIEGNQYSYYSAVQNQLYEYDDKMYESEMERVIVYTMLVEYAVMRGHKIPKKIQDDTKLAIDSAIEKGLDRFKEEFSNWRQPEEFETFKQDVLEVQQYLNSGDLIDEHFVMPTDG